MLYNLEGTPLGLLDVQCWVRSDEEMGQDRRDLPIEQKESYKWLQSFRAASALQAQCPQTQVVSMGDREADVYELFIAARADLRQTKFLVRAFQDRRLTDSEQGYLWAQLRAQPAVAAMKLKVPRKKKTTGAHRRGGSKIRSDRIGRPASQNRTGGRQSVGRIGDGDPSASRS